MIILGIETSCDETAAAVVRDGRWIISHVVASSLKEHAAYGGIIPEIASRRQMELINPVVRNALEQADLPAHAIDAVAVTQTPGLIGSLLVGIAYARALSHALSKPLQDINHVLAHLYANFLQSAHDDAVKASADKHSSPEPPRLPAVGLVVSGGHTSLYHVKTFRNFECVGETRDDAAGEAFDKTARILGLSYPGGPVIDSMAQDFFARKKTLSFHFPRAELADSLNFSFSGLKTAVLYHHRKHQRDPGYDIQEVAAAFQKSVVSVLVKKALSACREYRITTLLVGGGVAANSSLRRDLQAAAAEQGVNVYFPAAKLCLDNAAMIAGLAFHQMRRS